MPSPTGTPATQPTRFSLPILEDIRVASPCTADWDQMSGDDQARHCRLCDKKVYNLSGMTREQATRLVFEVEGKKCVRFYRREDGTVLTADCPVGLAAVRRRVAGVVRRVVAAAVCLVVAGLSIAVGRSDESRQARRARLQEYQPFLTLSKLVAKPLPVPPAAASFVMGDMVFQTPPSAPSAGSPAGSPTGPNDDLFEPAPTTLKFNFGNKP